MQSLNKKLVKNFLRFVFSKSSKKEILLHFFMYSWLWETSRKEKKTIKRVKKKLIAITEASILLNYRNISSLLLIDWWNLHQ